MKLSDIKLDNRSYDRIKSIVYSISGISLGSTKKDMVSSRLNKRLLEIGIGNFKDYCTFLKENDQECQTLINLISTNVTSFFRENDHFDYICDQIEAAYERGQRRFRIWSAACSTGQEPYSLAISLKERFQKNSSTLNDLKILATDISTTALEQANKGEYNSRASESIPDFTRFKYFNSLASGHYQINNEIKNLITFTQLNLTHIPYPMHGPLDVILCRNVMIYFDNQTKNRIINQFQKLMSKGSSLIVGHSESLGNLNSPFKLVKPSIYKY